MLQKFDDRNCDLIVNINGQLVHRDQAGISPFDSAVQGGDAVWEGLRLYNGRIFKLHEHLDRLERSAGADDALMLDTRGFVAETNATHIFIVRNSDKSRGSGDLATSRVMACPEGITRATVIEICAAGKIRCIETDLSVVDVYGAKEMF